MVSKVEAGDADDEKLRFATKQDERAPIGRDAADADFDAATCRDFLRAAVDRVDVMLGSGSGCLLGSGSGCLLIIDGEECRAKDPKQQDFDAKSSTRLHFDGRRSDT